MKPQNSIAAEIGRILIEFEIWRQQKAAAEGEDSEAHALATASTQATKKAARRGDSNPQALVSQAGEGRQ